MKDNIYMENEMELVSAAKAGNSEAFGLLYEANIKRIYDFIFFRTMNKEVAEDLVSEIFIKALRALPSFKIDGGSFSAWVYRIARHSLIDYYRKKKTSALEDFDLSDEGSWSEEAEKKVMFGKARELLLKLEPERREIVIMRIWDELSYAEISAITGKSEAAAKMIFKRAIETLRRLSPEGLLLLLLLISKLKI